MAPERWQQVKVVLDGALELGPEQRAAFLDQACSTDHSLRRDVESLLESADGARSEFLPTSAVRVALPKGTRLSDYEVHSLIGSGGVGNLWAQPIKGRPGHPITSFSSERIGYYGLSLEGDNLLLSRYHTDSDVVLLRDTSAQR